MVKRRGVRITPAPLIGFARRFCTPGALTIKWTSGNSLRGMSRQMKKRSAIFILLLCAAAAPAAVAQKTKPELFGVRLGMAEREARARLDKIGRWEQEKEQRRDSVWELKGDRRFSYVAVGFDKEARRVRYVTAFARAGGERVRPADVLDLGRAKRIDDPAGNYRLTQEVRARRGSPGYLVRAFGKDPDFITRLTVQRIEGRGGEKDDDDDK